MISPEGPPLARATALVDVLEALPRELRACGHEVSIVLPYYREIREVTQVSNLRDFEEGELKTRASDTGITVDVRVGEEIFVAEYLTGRTAGGVQIFFVRQDEFFDRAGLYGERGEAYEDNAKRFIFFSKAALELARRLTPSPEILHLHDWATALTPVWLREARLPFRSVLTIHHLAEQGSFWGLDFGLTNLPERYFGPRGVEFFGRMNMLKGGVVFADRVTTVSERYRREMLTEEGGCGLEIVLREHAQKLGGILNGADYERWNPEIDALLPAVFGPERIEGKRICRDALLAAVGLEPVKQVSNLPSDGLAVANLHSSGTSKLETCATIVYGMVTRLVPEKGFDRVVPVLDRLLSGDARLVILGEGDPAYETALAEAAKKFPGKFAYRQVYDECLAHLIEAGADITLIPSQIEPSGLSAMYSLKYGALPVASATGGIQEIIEDYDPSTDRGYGFLYYEPSADAFWDAIKRARESFRDEPLWQRLMQRAMRQDFAWGVAAQSYERIYAELSGQTATT
ncbi:MAG: glycogen synthase [Verrucomicrobiota bacterium]|nr:glycogen synthase [Verrucomicrobiota bacterium]